MNNKVQIFSFEDDQVRTIEIEGEPWFVGNDIAIILGYSNYRNAVINHVDNEDKLRPQIEYADQKREVTIINFKVANTTTMQYNRDIKIKEIER